MVICVGWSFFSEREYAIELGQPQEGSQKRQIPSPDFEVESPDDSASIWKVTGDIAGWHLECGVNRV